MRTRNRVRSKPGSARWRGEVPWVANGSEDRGRTQNPRRPRNRAKAKPGLAAPYQLGLPAKGASGAAGRRIAATLDRTLGVNTVALARPGDPEACFPPVPSRRTPFYRRAG